MNLRNVCAFKYSILLCLLGSGAGGCFVNTGQQALPAMTTAVPITPIYLGVSSSYLLASGGCNGAQSMTFTYSSALTPKTTISAACSNNTVNAHLPVSSGDQNQTFSLTMAGVIRASSGTSVTVTVSYTPPSPGLPGFAIEVGGGIIGAGAVTVD